MSNPATRAPIDLQNARKAVSFPVNELTELYYGKKFLDIRKKVLPLLEKEPIFSKKDFFYLGRTEVFNAAL
jgi:acyl-CoA oxidase